jgi:hypothetical protein
LPKDVLLVVLGEFSKEHLPMSFLFSEGILKTLNGEGVKSLEKVSNTNEVELRSCGLNGDMVKALDLS